MPRIVWSSDSGARDCHALSIRWLHASSVATTLSTSRRGLGGVLPNLKRFHHRPKKYQKTSQYHETWDGGIIAAASELTQGAIE